MMQRACRRFSPSIITRRDVPGRVPAMSSRPFSSSQVISACMRARDRPVIKVYSALCRFDGLLSMVRCIYEASVLFSAVMGFNSRVFKRRSI